LLNEKKYWRSRQITFKQGSKTVNLINHHERDRVQNRVEKHLRVSAGSTTTKQKIRKPAKEDAATIEACANKSNPNLTHVALLLNTELAALNGEKGNREETLRRSYSHSSKGRVCSGCSFGQ
jgi:hypothetical protein